MGQSNYIAAAITLAFVIYITARGSLPNYIALLTGSTGNGSVEAGEKTETTPEENATGVKEENQSDATKQPLSILQSVLSQKGPSEDILNSVMGVGL